MLKNLELKWVLKIRKAYLETKMLALQAGVRDLIDVTEKRIREGKGKRSDKEKLRWAYEQLYALRLDD